MDIAKALDIAREAKIGTLATLLPDGRPHLSIVTGAVVDGAIWISTRRGLVKERNLRREERATMLFGVRPWAAIEGTARFHEGDDVLEKLRLYYRTAAGEHPDWDDYDRAMREEQRLIVELEPQRAYGFA